MHAVTVGERIIIITVTTSLQESMISPADIIHFWCSMNLNLLYRSVMSCGKANHMSIISMFRI